MKVGIKGVQKTIRKIKRFEDNYIRQVKRVIVETAEMMVTQMKALAPEDEGSLKDSIHINYKLGGLTAEIRVGVHYAIYVEFGTGIYAVKDNGRKTPWVYYDKKLKRYVYTRGMKAQPFFFPAVDIGARFFNTEMDKLS